MSAKRSWDIGSKLSGRGAPNCVYTCSVGQRPWSRPIKTERPRRSQVRGTQQNTLRKACGTSVPPLPEMKNEPAINQSHRRLWDAGRWHSRVRVPSPAVSASRHGISLAKQERSGGTVQCMQISRLGRKWVRPSPFWKPRPLPPAAASQLPGGGGRCWGRCSGRAASHPGDRLLVGGTDICQYLPVAPARNPMLRNPPTSELIGSDAGLSSIVAAPTPRQHTNSTLSFLERTSCGLEDITYLPTTKNAQLKREGATLANTTQLKGQTRENRKQNPVPLLGRCAAAVLPNIH